MSRFGVFPYAIYITKWKKEIKWFTSLRCFVFETIQKPKTLKTFWWTSQAGLGRWEAKGLIFLYPSQNTIIHFFWVPITPQIHLINSLHLFYSSFSSHSNILYLHYQSIFKINFFFSSPHFSKSIRATITHTHVESFTCMRAHRDMCIHVHSQPCIHTNNICYDQFNMNVIWYLQSIGWV